MIRLLEPQMQAAAEELDFELAALLRDQMLELKVELSRDEAAVRLRADELSRFGEELGRGLRRPGRDRTVGRAWGRQDHTGAGDVPRPRRRHAPVTSPTYALVHRYERRRRPVYHVDCYRLRSPDDARDLGFDDMTREGAIVLIEWPERAGPWMPPLDRHFRLATIPIPTCRIVEER